MCNDSTFAKKGSHLDEIGRIFEPLREDYRVVSSFGPALCDKRGIWARAVTATTSNGRVQTIPISVNAAGQPPVRTGLQAKGPQQESSANSGGTIGWFDRREPRGISARSATLHQNCCTGFARVIFPDRNDFLAVAIGDKTLMSFGGGPRRGALPDDAICVGLVSRGGFGAGCRESNTLFHHSPLDLSWGFSGAGQQTWIVSGLASDDVDRIEVFLGNGERWRAPLLDNATAFRIQRAKFPARIVAYDKAGLVIAVKTISGG